MQGANTSLCLSEPHGGGGNGSSAQTGRGEHISLTSVGDHPGNGNAFSVIPGKSLCVQGQDEIVPEFHGTG